MSSKHLGYYHHNKLPHFDQADAIQCITIRLQDALLPAHIRQLKMAGNAPARSEFRELDDRLDRGYGASFLIEPHIARIIIDALEFRDGRVFRMYAWVLMPNHMHMIIRQMEDQPLGTIVKSFKTYTARDINKTRSRTGQVWQFDYFDRLIRSERQLSAAVDYLHYNPVKAGLVSQMKEWEYGSYRSYQRKLVQGLDPFV